MHWIRIQFWLDFRWYIILDNRSRTFREIAQKVTFFPDCADFRCLFWLHTSKGQHKHRYSLLTKLCRSKTAVYSRPSRPQPYAPCWGRGSLALCPGSRRGVCRGICVRRASRARTPANRHTSISTATHSSDERRTHVSLPSRKEPGVLAQLESAVSIHSMHVHVHLQCSHVCTCMTYPKGHLQVFTAPHFHLGVVAAKLEEKRPVYC